MFFRSVPVLAIVLIEIEKTPERIQGLLIREIPRPWEKGQTNETV